MPRFLIHHRHDPQLCGVAYAAFKGLDSALRQQPALASCAAGGHGIWWVVEQESAADALALLPFFVAERSTVIEVTDVVIP